MGVENIHQNRGEELLDLLIGALKELEGAGEGMRDYRSYLHGQIYGIATALRIIYPGPGSLGEKAALAVRPVLTEHECRCSGEEPHRK